MEQVKGRCIDIVTKGGPMTIENTLFKGCAFFFKKYGMVNFKNCVLEQCSFRGDDPIDIRVFRSVFVACNYNTDPVYVTLYDCTPAEALYSFPDNKTTVRLSSNWEIQDMRLLQKHYKDFEYWIGMFKDRDGYNVPANLKDCFIEEEIPKVYSSWDDVSVYHKKELYEGYPYNIVEVYLEGAEIHDKQSIVHKKD